MKTIVHAYRFDVSEESEREAHNALCEKLRARGLRCFNVLASASSKEHRAHRAAILSRDGKTIELETKHLFDNQWNTAPIPGYSENGLRVFDWYESIFPNENIKEGYYLDQTPEMREARRNTLKCGFCGAQEPAAKGYVFCPHCLDSPYLDEGALHLTRLMPIEKTSKKRAPLSESERAHLLPLYLEAQTVGGKSRAKASRDKARAKAIAKYDKAIETATSERDGMLWLLDNGFNVDNVIFYSHTGVFSFGWRRPLGENEVSRLLDVISEFPFPYEIKRKDGKTLEGY